MSRPKIQHSNITYYAIQRQKIEFPPELEELSEPLEIKTPVVKLSDSIGRVKVSRLSDNLCPPHLTEPLQRDTLLIYSNNGEPNE
jgi:hypothetical protein